MINYFPTIVDVHLVPIFFILGFIISLKIKLFISISSKEVSFLYIYHTIFCLIYFSYSMEIHNDSVFYYRNTFHPDFQNYNFGFGTPFIQSLIKLIVLNLKSSLLSVFFLFNIIGSLGIILIYSAFQKLDLDNNLEKFVILIICFLPSIYFWSSAVGKESFTYLATGLIMNSFHKRKINYFFLFLAFIFLLLVRPFMAGFLIISIFFGLLLKKNKYYLLLLPVFTFSLFTFLKYIVNYLDRLSINVFYNYETFISFIKQRKSDTYANEFTDMTQEGFLYHFFSYTFRPLLFERFDLLAIISSFENLFLLFVSYLCIRKFNLKNILYNNHLIILLYSILTCFFLTIATYNLGIAIRQKWFFLLPLFFIIFYKKGKQ